ncbi:hypothetical protein PIB30_054485 [Stylosanthes scabra]|uniref:Uncharacterized protein n=1 Tax=Stylosanthes scabra TaxID=79078 RepID=A0ABU6ZHK4_9FABA|nr:hypothetical protein [Stylosanthes scabra]
MGIRGAQGPDRPAIRSGSGVNYTGWVHYLWPNVIFRSGSDLVLGHPVRPRKENFSSFPPNQWKLRHLRRRDTGDAKLIAVSPSIRVRVPFSVTASAFPSPLLRSIFMVSSLQSVKELKPSKRWIPRLATSIFMDCRCHCRHHYKKRMMPNQKPPQTPPQPPKTSFRNPSTNIINTSNNH